MTPAEIVITCCLGAAPLFLGVLVGLLLSHAYRNLHEKLRDMYLRENNAVVDFLLNRLMLEEWVSERRAKVILVFWPTVFAAAGGFLAGSYMQFVFGWWTKFMELMFTV